MANTRKRQDVPDTEHQQAEAGQAAKEPEAGTQEEQRQEAEEPPAKKQHVARAEEAPKNVLEEGLIYFMYRPLVATEEAHSLSDVQRFYMILSPDRKDALKRLIAVPKKKLPAQKERFFGFVGAVAKDMESLTDGLGPQDRETKTRGIRHTDPARVAGEGRYAIVKENGRDTDLVWQLEVPEHSGTVQKDLCISQEGNIHVSIKNPAKASPPNAGLSKGQKANFGEKQEMFEGTPGGYAWIPVHDPSMLDVQNCELLLIGGSPDIEATAGSAVEEHLKEQAEKDKEEADKVGGLQESKEEKLVDKMKEELKAERAHLEVEPAEDGDWK